MLKKRRLSISKKTKEFQIQINEEAVKNNLYRLRIMSLLVFVLELIFLLLTFLPFIRSSYDFLWRYRIMYIAAGSFALLILMVTSRYTEYLKQNQSKTRFLMQFAFFCTLQWSVVLSVFDQIQGLDGVTYIFFSIIIAVIFIINPFNSGLIYGSSLLTYIALTLAWNPNNDVVFSNFINTSSVIITAWIVSVVLNERHIEDVYKRKVIEKQRIELEEIVMLDPMTNLYNRRGLEVKLKDYLQISKVKDDSLAVFMFDIDCFKGINDTYGHLRGDEIIRIIADEIIKISNQYGGMGCRYGGDEFCMVLPYISIDKACEVCEKFKVSILALRIENVTSTEEILSVSCGFASGLAREIKDPWDLVNIADKELYRVKKSRIIKLTTSHS